MQRVFLYSLPNGLSSVVWVLCLHLTLPSQQASTCPATSSPEAGAHRDSVPLWSGWLSLFQNRIKSPDSCESQPASESYAGLGTRGQIPQWQAFSVPWTTHHFSLSYVFLATPGLWRGQVALYLNCVNLRGPGTWRLEVITYSSHFRSFTWA